MSGRTDGATDAVGVAVTTILGLYAINDYVTPLGAPFWRLTYAGVLTLFMTCVVALVVIQNGVITAERSGLWLTLIASALFAIGFVPVPLQPIIFPTYVAGDSASFILLALISFLIASRPHVIQDRRLMYWLMLMLFMAAIVGLTIGGQFQGERFSGRFDPPHMLLFAGFAALWITNSNTRSKYVSGIAILVLLVLAVLSGQRTAPITFIAVILFSIALVMGTKKTVWIAAVTTMLVIAAISIAGDRLIEAVRLALLEGAVESRYEELVKLGGDQSLQGRIFEAIDVMTIAGRDGPFALILGHGHGATFAPILSFPEPNVTSTGRVHNIHIGPFLLFYRYGLVGVCAYLALVIIVLKDFVRFDLFRRFCISHGRPAMLFVFLTFYLAVVGIFANFHLRTVLNDPIAVFSLAGYLATRGALSGIIGPFRLVRRTDRVVS